MKNTFRLIAKVTDRETGFRQSYASYFFLPLPLLSFSFNVRPDHSAGSNPHILRHSPYLPAVCLYPILW
jgi:hypothetical protein